jgi:transcriptional regulator with XRE-family HTH domain
MEGTSSPLPTQIKAARAPLGWSQQELAARASVATSTVADFERGQRSPVPNNLEAIRSALEDAGISFPARGAIAGPPPSIRLRSNVTPDRLKPVRWVTETDLAHWADRRDGQTMLPELIRRLILAERGYLLWIGRTGGYGGRWAPISGRTLPPTAAQRAKPMDIRVIVFLIETSCLYSPPSEGKSRRAVRSGGLPGPPVIAICKIVVCRSCSDRPKSCRQVPRKQPASLGGSDGEGAAVLCDQNRGGSTTEGAASANRALAYWSVPQ